MCPLIIMAVQRFVSLCINIDLAESCFEWQHYRMECPVRILKFLVAIMFQKNGSPFELVKLGQNGLKFFYIGSCSPLIWLRKGLACSLGTRGSGHFDFIDIYISFVRKDSERGSPSAVAGFQRASHFTSNQIKR